MLRAVDLSAGYGGRALARLPELTVGEGQTALLLGPSGSGKTTLLLAMAGLAEVLGGRLTIGDVDVPALKARARDRFRGQSIGLIFQDLNLISGLTTIENVLLAPFAAGAPQDRPRALGLLDELGLAEWAQSPRRDAQPRPGPAHRHRPRHADEAARDPRRRAHRQPGRRELRPRRGPARPGRARDRGGTRHRHARSAAARPHRPAGASRAGRRGGGARMNIARLVAAFVRRRPLTWAFHALTLSLGVAVLTALLALNSGLSRRFERDLAGVDLVVGAKGSPLQLIMSSVFQLDQPTGNIPLSVAEQLSRNMMVRRAVPVSLGDNVGGFRIVGTLHGLRRPLQGAACRGPALGQADGGGGRVGGAEAPAPEDRPQLRRRPRPVAGWRGAHRLALRAGGGAQADGLGDRPGGFDRHRQRLAGAPPRGRRARRGALRRPARRSPRRGQEPQPARGHSASG